MNPLVEGYGDQIILEEKEALNVELNRYDVISCLSEGLYKIPFSANASGNVTFVVKATRTGNSGIRLEMEDGSTFFVTVKEDK